MDAIGPRSAVLVLREAFYGTTRFDEFVSRTRSTDAIVSARLKQLAAVGILEKRPYRESGKRTQFEYVLTPAGEELMPVIFGLMQWGNRHLQPERGPLKLVERKTGAAVVIGPRSESGKALHVSELELVANGDWSDSQG
jgi:DNA-binding HxlR family transcriptional regulator